MMSDPGEPHIPSGLEFGEAAPRPRLVNQDEESRDLGFGSIVARDARRRLLNRDGTFNVRRRGLGWLKSLSAYHALLTMSWPRFFALLVGFYGVANAIFAAIYWSLGPRALASSVGDALGTGYVRAFFFSVETLATIGYGNISPVGIGPHLIVTVESFVGLLLVALMTGLVFARFSRPTADILFSERAVVAPYRGASAFEFRIVNRRRNELLELQVRVVLNRFVMEHGVRTRKFFALALERPSVTFFPLAWTVVHPIDQVSPLWGVSREAFFSSEPEFLVLLTGIDGTVSQTVHSRTSYLAGEILWGARFASVFDEADQRGLLSIDVRRVHDIVPAEMTERMAARE